MIIRGADRVGSALDLAATFHALSDAALVLEANLRASAVAVSVALSDERAAGGEIFRVAIVAWWTDALAAVASSTWTTFDVFAQVFAFSAITLESGWTEDVLAALAVLRIVTETLVER